MTSHGRKDGLRQIQSALDTLFLRTFEAMHAAAIDAKALRAPPHASHIAIEGSQERIAEAYELLVSQIDSLEELNHHPNEQNAEIEALSTKCQSVADQVQLATSELLQLQSAIRPWLADGFATLTLSQQESSKS